MRIDWFISVVLRMALSFILSVILPQASVANAAEVKVFTSTSDRDRAGQDRA